MGRAFVQQIMDKYRRLDEIWVIARHLQKEMWQERFGTKIVLLPLDLLQEAQQERLRCRLFAGQDFGKCRRNGMDRNI